MKLASAIILTVVLATAAQAAPWGKPGLWEMSTTMKMKVGGMPTLKPEQLARLKKMGVKLPNMNGTSVDSKVCVSPQEAMRAFDTARYAHERSGCKQQSVVRTGSHIKSTVVCDGEMKGTGMSDVTLIDDAHYATVFAFKGTSHGRPADMSVSTKAHWLGAACGNIKPMQVQLPHHG